MHTEMDDMSMNIHHIMSTHVSCARQYILKHFIMLASQHKQGVYVLVYVYLTATIFQYMFASSVEYCEKIVEQL